MEMENKIKYKTLFNRIEAVEIVRETEKQVVLPGRNGGRGCRENKRSDWSNWHDTWEEAHAFLVSNAEKDVERARMRLEITKGVLGQLKGMKMESEVWNECNG